jgi:hypothetical protein
MWATIESYAVGLDKNVLPPFIHRSIATKELGGREIDFVNLPEPLANCKQIVPMYFQKTPASRSLVAKTMILEVQRLHNEVSDISRREIVSDYFSFPHMTTKICSSHFRH